MWYNKVHLPCLPEVLWNIVMYPYDLHFVPWIFLFLLTFLSGFCWKICQITQKHSYILLNVTHLTASNDLMCFWFNSPTITVLTFHLEQYEPIQSVPHQPFLLSNKPNFLEAAKAGVPEHFNAPFHLAKERGLYEAQGIDMQILGWTVGGCLGVGGGEYIIYLYLFACFSCVCVCLFFFSGYEVGEGLKVEIWSESYWVFWTLFWSILLRLIVCHFWVQTEAVTGLSY